MLDAIYQFQSLTLALKQNDDILVNGQIIAMSTSLTKPKLCKHSVQTLP